MFLMYDEPQYFNPDTKRAIEPSFGQMCPSRSPIVAVRAADESNLELIDVGGFHCSYDVHPAEVTHKAGNNMYVFWAEWDDDRETD
jgi:hypothetical protein